MIGFKKIIYFLKHFIIVNFVIIFTFILGMILGVASYKFIRSGNDLFWIKPALSIFPFIYISISFYFLMKRNYFKFICFLIMFFYFIIIFFHIYNKNELFQDYIHILNFNSKILK